MYELISNLKSDSELGTYETYGITILHDGKVTRTINDISTFKEKIQNLVDQCNYLKVSEIQIEEIIYDFID